MKKLSIIAFVIVTFCCHARAQDIKTLDYINPAQIIGVYDFGMQAGVLCTEGSRSIDQKDLYSLRFLNSVNPVQEIVVDQNSRLMGTETSTANNVLIFNNAEDVSLIYVDPTSKPIEKRIETLKDYRFHQVTETYLSKTGVLTLIRNYTKLGLDRNGRDSIVESGMEYLTVSVEGNVTNRRYDAYNQDLPNFNIVGIFPTNQGMVYLMEHSARSKKNYELRVDICDNGGSLTGQHTLTGEQTHFPSEIIAKNGQIIVSGYYLNGNVFTSKKTEGLFTMILKSDGSVVSSNLYEWDNLKSKLRETKRAEFVFNGKMNMLVEHVAPTSTGYRIICESYTGGSGTTTAEFLLGASSSDEYVITVHDFVVFETNMSGEIVNIDIVEKDVSNIEIGGRAKRLPVLQLVSMLKKHSIFPFQSVNGDVVSFIQYKNNIGYFSEINILTGEVTEGKSVIIEPEIIEEVDEDYEKLKANNETINKLDRFSQKMDNFEKKVDEVGNKVVYSLEKIDRRFNPYERSETGFFILDDNKILSYNINDKTYKLYFAFID